MIAYLNIIVPSISYGPHWIPRGGQNDAEAGIIIGRPGSPKIHQRREFKKVRFSMIGNTRFCLRCRTPCAASGSSWNSLITTCCFAGLSV